MEYSINGWNLTNATYGWALRPVSMPLSAFEANIVTRSTPNVDGVVNGLTSYNGPALTLVVTTPLEHLETLNALFMSPRLELRKVGSTKVAVVTLLNSTVRRIYGQGTVVDMGFVVQIDGAYWRDAADVTSAVVSLDTASVSLDVLSGLSAPVQDAMVRVRGACAGLNVRDSGGSWFSYTPALAANTYLRFHLDTGRAYTTTTDVWTGGTEVSGGIDYGGPRGVFEITPYWSANPATRLARLTVSTSSRTSAQISTRGRRAYTL